MIIDPETENHGGSLGEILGRAFESVPKLAPGTAEMILQADFPNSDKDRVESLLRQKAESGLSKEEEILLDTYLNADLVLTILKSKARQTLRQPIAA